MWTRAELKGRAKDCLRRYYWMAFLVSLVASLLTTGITGGGSGIRRGLNLGNRSGDYRYQAGQAFGDTDPALAMAVMSVVAVVLLAMFVFGILWGIFMGNVVSVGCCRYFMESRAKKGSAGFGRLFFCFKRGMYFNVVKTMFMKDLFVFLWSLLLIIPGIIKSYEYYMVPYILSENPGIDYRDALALSRQMMDGQKFKLFVLQWSFIGWEFLGLLLCCVGVQFVLPYELATFAELYAVLREGTGAVGTVLPGYGYGEETETAAVDTDYTVL